eukprot:CAMPEP_0167770988 /NCGR_PEP_ID=MMETSP0111_2-20121227/21_1 /TAXON_ID=91324 /ORGANISM="Lotharella globosa, Strain CCCM811" /LENGTH=332 /DNA_ID=CAMNT_0007660277 /DNA_START=200 /DNA_END=1198 /DNA_ORIENTATION=+
MMMLLNKSLASRGGKIPLSCVMLVQNLATLILVHIFDSCLATEAKARWRMNLPPLRVQTCLAWLPVNLIFLVMLFSGFKTLQLVTVSLVSVCKNITNVFTTFGDRMLFGEPVSFEVLIALMLMIIAAYLGASDELRLDGGRFNMQAGFWMTVNCLATSAYGLQIKLSQKQTGLSPYGCTFYNALVATPLTFLWTIWNGDLLKFLGNVELLEPQYLFSLTMSSLIGFGIGFSVFWCISATSPTTYAMVGAANKIPLAVLGIMVFSEPVTANRVLFISIGLLAGIVYARAKSLLKKQGSKNHSRGPSKQEAIELKVDKLENGNVMMKDAGSHGE